MMVQSAPSKDHGPRNSNVRSDQRVPVNEHEAHLIAGAAGRIGSPGMKTERRRAMSNQTLDGAVLRSDQRVVDVESGKGNEARLLAAAKSGHSVAFGELFDRYKRR